MSFAVVSAALMTLLALAACTVEITDERGVTPEPQDTPSPGLYRQSYPYGSDGMMGGMMGPGMMGGWGGYSPNAQPLTLEQATEAASRVLNAYRGDLKLKEVMEFERNFYAEVEEHSTGIHAMELLVDKYTGQVYPETGPNMTWNTKYGMMTWMMGSSYGGRLPTTEMPTTPQQAKALAQQFLDSNRTGLQAADPDTFYGYYTLHTLKDGQIEGMLSVNGYTGQVWYHTWHGPFVQMTEVR